jgi:drug/metabolite transporter (DMT)-like permease
MRSRNGFLIAAAGFALLTSGDAVIKSMAGLWPVPAIAALRFTLAVPLLAGIVLLSQGASGFVVQRPWVQVGRGLMLAISSVLFFLSLFVMPLAEATAIVFVSPVMTALLSALLLNEPMRPRAWLSTALALVGVALVLRPNLAELGQVALFPLGAALCFSTMIILNRIAAGTGSAMALQWAMVSIAAPVVLLFALVGHWSGASGMEISWPENGVILRCVIVAVSASAAHWLIFQGTVRTTAADAAQAVYIQLPVALLMDALLFGHFPDLTALSGSALIVGAGFLIWWNQSKAV